MSGGACDFKAGRVGVGAWKSLEQRGFGLVVAASNVRDFAKFPVTTVASTHGMSEHERSALAGLCGCCGTDSVREFAGALVALSLVKDTMVVSLGLSIAHDSPLTLDPRQSVTIETDSSPHMVLYALQAPGPGFDKDDVAVLRQLNSRSLPVRPHVPASGFLFFPFDHKATRFVVVVKVEGETFHFPFAQAQAKFGDPARLGPGSTAGNAVGRPERSR